MGRVVVVKCPLCGWSRRYKGDADFSGMFSNPDADYVVMIQEVGGKHRRTLADLDRVPIKVGRGQTRGRVQVLERIPLGELDQKTKNKIKQKTKKIINDLG